VPEALARVAAHGVTEVGAARRVENDDLTDRRRLPPECGRVNQHERSHRERGPHRTARHAVDEVGTHGGVMREDGDLPLPALVDQRRSERHRDSVQARVERHLGLLARRLMLVTRAVDANAR
jgi:hypothetical protein